MGLSRSPIKMGQTARLFLGKKGFLITLLALLLASFLGLMFSANLTNLPDYKVELLQNRVTLLNYYLESFFDYAENVAVISGYMGLQGVVYDIENRSSYNPNFMTEYPLCVAVGNLTLTRTCPGMKDKSLSFFLENISESVMEELKINSSYFINNLTVSPNDDPFSISLNINLTLYIADAFAKINSTRILSVRIPIEGVLDPLYAVDGFYDQRIVESAISKREGTWNRSDFEELYNRHEYRSAKRGVSFINRILGNITNSSLGIESYVNHTQANVSEILAANTNLSIVDYLFWNRTSFDCAARNPVLIVYLNESDVPSIPASSPTPLPLDTDHWAEFNFSSGTSYTCS
ncbi:hypothetical protein JW711_03180 [Candidatus Woesearchaeota archaeon]|nr:hypothetical protein [Candidatus Woesearchaeota archaeon]